MATLALNAGEWFRRGRLLMCCSPANTGSILAHRSSLSTFSRVQFCAATSVHAQSPARTKKLNLPLCRNENKVVHVQTDSFPAALPPANVCFGLMQFAIKLTNGSESTLEQEVSDMAARIHPTKHGVRRSRVVPFLRLDENVASCPYDGLLCTIEYRQFVPFNVDLHEPQSMQLVRVKSPHGNANLSSRASVRVFGGVRRVDHATTQIFRKHAERSGAAPVR